MLVCRDSVPVQAPSTTAGGDVENWVLGFDLLECRDMAQAIEVASAHPLATHCVLEIRPVSTE
jgi:hypothetical protein